MAKKEQNKKIVKPSQKSVKANNKKKKKLQVQKGIVMIKSTYNNTILSATDNSGNVLAWSSPGIIGFTGSRKSTAYAATKAAEDLVSKTAKYGLKEVKVIIRGAGLGRQAAVKGLRSAGLKLSSLSDHTPIPHGGTSPRKQPRGS